MDEHAVREAVRAALARHVGVSAPPEDLTAEVRRLSERAAELVLAIDQVQRRLGNRTREEPGQPPASSIHASHYRFTVARSGAELGSACLIEPSVQCVHCGFCQSLGH